jgi:uncharacterized protein YbjT (DUF2867 family)
MFRDGGRSSAAESDFGASGCDDSHLAPLPAAVLTAGEMQSGRVYELAGDVAYTRAELAAEIAR